MRSLPSTKLVRPPDHDHSARSSYDVIGTGTDNHGALLGQVIRDYGSGATPWNAFIATTHPVYGPGVRMLRDVSFRTRQEALIAVLKVCQREAAEREAYEILAIIQKGNTSAEEEAARQLAVTGPDIRMIASRFCTRGFSVSRRVVLQELATERADLRNRLAGEKPMGPYLFRNAYMIRMAELEIERRDRQDSEG